MEKKIQIAWVVAEEVPAGIWGTEGSFGVKKGDKTRI